MSRWRDCIALLGAGMVMAGCVYLAPIDEDPEPEDKLPYIDVLSGVNPSMGLVNINLSLGGNQEFVISNYGDDNAEQLLYHREVIDMRLAGETNNPIFAIAPKIKQPDARDKISYNFPACQFAQSYPGAIAEGKMINFYLLISDSPFTHQNQLFSSMDFGQPFETNEKNRAVWVEWTLQFMGVCPAK
jgi:hypothetical protein